MPSTPVPVRTKWRKALPQAHFVLLFATCFLMGIGLVLLPPGQRIDQGFSRLLVRISHALIGICGGAAAVEGAILRAPGGFAIEMRDGCNGVNVTVLLWAAILAFPASWKLKSYGLAVGTLAIQLLNVARFISLFYIGQYSMTWFEFAHAYLWETLLILDTIVVFWLWVGRVSRARALRHAGA